MASAFDSAGEASVDLGEVSELVEDGLVLFAAECGDHACEVTDGRDLWAEPLADRFSRRRASEVVVAPARARRLGDDLEFARGGVQVDERLVLDRRFVDGECLAVGALGAELFERDR